MNPFLTLFKKITPSLLQLVVIIGLVFTAYVFYNLGAGTHSGNPADDSSTVSASNGSTSKDGNGDGVIYTCSMHPQIKQDEPGDCPICGMDLVEQKVNDAQSASSQSQKQSGKEEPVGYACAMNCVPPLEEEGKCPICGMEMQPVYESRNGKSNLNTQRMLSISKEARALADIQTSLVEKEPAVRTVRLVGQLAIDPSRRVHISADVGGRLDRMYAKFDGDVVATGQDLVLFYSPELLAVQQEFLQALRSMNNLQPSTLTTVKESNQMAVNAARERLRLAGLTTSQIDELAESKQAKVSVVLKAPMGGTVITRHSEEGEYVNQGEHIVTIADLSLIWSELEAYESDLVWIQEGQPVTFTTNALPGRIFSGKVAYVDPILNPQTRTTRVRVNVENKKGLLKPGMYVTGTIESTLHNGEPQLIIPKSAPLITGERAVVYVEVPNQEKPTYVGREIELGPQTKDGYVVYEGMAEGELIVTNGSFQIDSALQIVAKPSMMNPKGGRSSSAHEGHGNMMEDQSPSESNSYAIGQDLLATILPLYLEIKKQLAADNFEQAVTAWEALHQKWNNPPKSVQDGVKAIDIEALRTLFEPVSETLIAAVRQHGNPFEQNLKLAHCPMAFDFDGANWLQTDSEIRNPYFGASMLTCGTIQEEFTAHD